MCQNTSEIKADHKNQYKYLRIPSNFKVIIGVEQNNHSYKLTAPSCTLAGVNTFAYNNEKSQLPETGGLEARSVTRLKRDERNSLGSPSAVVRQDSMDMCSRQGSL